MKHRFKNVAVLMGGPSSEREVSLNSGAAIAAALRSLGYNITEVDVTTTEVTLPSGTDAVFIALHGTFGEDGGVQAILEQKRIPYTGAGVQSSRLAFDKIASKRIFERQAIATPRYEILANAARRTLPLPVVVKPPREGSSVGVTVVREESDWRPALEKVFAMKQEALVESFIEGRELTVGIVGDQVLPLIEIRPHSGLYDYTSKYTKGETDYLVPAPVEVDVARRCQEIAWQVHQALGCRGMGRVDFRLAPDNELFVLELNTIPGFTATSLLPKAARCAGVEFPELCERILNLAALDD